MACFAFGILPFSSIRFPFAATPTKNPTESNKSINKKVNTTITISKLNIFSSGTLKACIKVGASDGTLSETIFVGKVTIPVNIPIADVNNIDSNNAPLTFLQTNIPAIPNPTTLNTTSGSCKLDNANVPFAVFIIPAFVIPTDAINSPTPAVTAFLRSFGIQFIICSLKLVTVKIINNTPSINTPKSAICHVYPICKTTVYAKNAFSPIPGARAIG